MMLRIVRERGERKGSGTRPHGPSGPVEESGFYFVGNWGAIEGFQAETE